MKRTLAILALALCTALPALANTYTVDPPGANGPDDTVSIQDALGNEENNEPNRIVLLQAGTYHVGPLQIGRNTVLQGAGSGKTVLLFNPDQAKRSNVLANMLSDETYNNDAHDESITIRGITFDGNKTHEQPQFYQQIVKMVNVIHLTVDDCIFQNGNANGLVIMNTSQLPSSTLVENSSALNNEARGFYGNSIDTADGLQDVTFQNCLAQNNSGGFSVYLASGIRYINCTAAQNGFIARGLTYSKDWDSACISEEKFCTKSDANPGFGLDSSVNVSYTDCVSKENLQFGFAAYARFRPTQYLTYTRAISVRNGMAYLPGDDVAFGAAGFHIQSSEHSTFTDCQSSQNGIGFDLVSTLEDSHATSGSPILTNDILIDGADIRKNREQGIVMEGVTDSTVSDSTIVNNSYLTSTSGVYDGVLLKKGTQTAAASGTERVTISGCTISNTDGLTHQAWGVRSINTSDYISLLNNKLSGNSQPNSTAVSYSLVGPHTTVSGNY